MSERAAWVCVGAIAGAFGVRGEVRLKSFCAEPERIADYGALRDDSGRAYSVAIVRAVKSGFAVRLSGVETREAAEALKGARLHAARDRLPPLEEEEYYHADLVGLTVIDTGGALLGHVRTVWDHGAGDMLEIALEGGGQALLPFTRAAVPTVDIAGGRLIADPPAGVLGGEEEARGRDDQRPPVPR